MSEKGMKLNLKIWRQKSSKDKGGFVDYKVENISPNMSFLEMLDVLNEKIILEGGEPIAFDNDCREGICGMCGLYINGRPHGPQSGTTTCQLHMRSFRDGELITIEPWRCGAFPIVKDLIVDRSALDKIIMAGGFISVSTGAAPEANTIPVPRDDSENSMDAAQCIGCGACIAACPNASAMLFTAAKISHLGLLPQGQPERKKRALSMVKAMDDAGFGGCTNHGECEAACPKNVSTKFIARMNRDYISAGLTEEPEKE